MERLKSIQGKSTHSAWLTFMYPRLYLAKKLLKDSGVIFVSIDDNEQANLKLLLDEVFGEDSFVNRFTWINKPEGRSLRGLGANGTTEVLYCYGKNITELLEFKASSTKLMELMPNNYKGYSRDIQEDEKGPYIATHELYNGNSAFNEETRPNLVFDIWYRESDNSIKFEKQDSDDFVYIEPHRNSDGIHKYHAYRWSKKKIQEEIEDLLFVRRDDTYRIFTKRRDFDYVVAKDLIADITTASGGQDLRKLDISGFDFPKPVNLIKFLLLISAKKDSLILDFFAGTATTADAVMQLNAEDGGKRKFILAQLPEPTPEKSVAKKSGYTTIDQISRERIKRAGTKIKSENPLTTADLDTGFKHYRFVEPIQKALDQIEFDANMSIDLFDDMISLFSSESLSVDGKATGFDTLLQTYLLADNYTFETPVMMKDFAGTKVAYANNTRLYIITDAWSAENTKALVNAIGTNELTVQTIVVYGYTLPMEAIRELEIALNQLETKVNLQIRY